MSEENAPGADQRSGARAFLASLFRASWPTPKLIAWVLVLFWLVPGVLALALTGYSWGHFARYTVLLFIILGLGVIWNERERKGTKGEV
jgi:uncharacterized membrane protein